MRRGGPRAVHLRSGLDKARREAAEYERFRDLVGQVTEVNEAICAARPATSGGAAGDDVHAPTGLVDEHGRVDRPAAQREVDPEHLRHR